MLLLYYQFFGNVNKKIFDFCLKGFGGSQHAYCGFFFESLLIHGAINAVTVLPVFSEMSKTNLWFFCWHFRSFWDPKIIIFPWNPNFQKLKIKKKPQKNNDYCSFGPETSFWTQKPFCLEMSNKNLWFLFDISEAFLLKKNLCLNL